MTDFEFYETPETYTRYLFSEVEIAGVCCEPFVGSGAIVAASERLPNADSRIWVTNDLDPFWGADQHADATARDCWERLEAAAGGRLDWTVSNPAFTPALAAIELALEYSRVGVAMHLRASIHEVLKTGPRRTWMADHLPAGNLWLPRFAYQRSPTTGKWTTDSVCACWVIWLKNRRAPQFFRYAPEWVIDDLLAETPAYRSRMDRLMRERAA